ncbi:hypothetical protein BCD_1518 (plasmid) [Borrelia crocidurae DOU]|uniref:Uncharacterized protein n=1 Tax=Borrelia crocidurae DOU TaxID=1293575 RepID=W5SKA9_9SPIR|nr:hypothetical protein BCD_1518 [Borrelia crocidurae DOU]
MFNKIVFDMDREGNPKSEAVVAVKTSLNAEA